MALHLQDQLLQAIQANDTSTVGQLLEDGADPNAGLLEGDFSALSIAVRNGAEDIVDLLLRHGRHCCMVEHVSESPATSDPDPGVDSNSTNALVRRVVAPIGLSLAWTSVVRYILRRFGWQRSHKYQAILMAAGHYLAWVEFTAKEALSLNVNFSWPFYLSYKFHVGNLIMVSILHRLHNAVTGRLSGDYAAASRRGLRFPGFAQDIFFSILSHMAIHSLVSCVRYIGIRAGLMEKPPAISPEVISRIQRRDWVPPAKKVLDAVLESTSVTESIVLKLLQADMLALRPYSKSHVVLELCDLAIDRCWSEVLVYLVRKGAILEPLDHRYSLQDTSWPHIIEAIVYVFPAAEPKGFATASFEGITVRDSIERPPWSLMRPKPAFHALMESTTFQRLVSSDLESDEALCEKMMDILVEAGADPTAIHHHCDAACSIVRPRNNPCSARVLEHFLRIRSAAALPRPEGSLDQMLTVGEPALHSALNSIKPNLEHVELLLRIGGYSVSAENSKGRTPKFVAAYMNETTEAMELLLDHGADPNDGGSKGYPPLMRALEDSSLGKFMFLLARGANLCVRHADKNILTIVMELPDTLVVLKHQLVRTSPALRVGTAQRCYPGYKELILDMLIDSIPKIYLQGQLNDALEFCCRESEPPFFRRPHIFALFYLLRKGAKPMVAKQGFNNLLHLICDSGNGSGHEYHDDMAALLGECSLNINAVGNGNNRPLHLAIIQMKRDFVLLLLEHGATTDVEDDHHMTPLQVLCSKPCSEYDLTYSSEEIDNSLDDPYYQGKRGEGAFTFDLRAARMDVKTSLEQEEILQALLNHGADPLKVDSSGRNAFMLACEKGNTVLVAGILYWLHQSPAVLSDTILNGTDNEGNSCFHITAAQGHIRTLKVLLGSQHLRQPVRNEWREKAIRDEESARSIIFTKHQELQRQEDDYVKSPSGPFLRGRSMVFTPPQADVKFTIGSEGRMTEESITLPNVSVSEWGLTRATVTNEAIKLILRTNMQGETPLHCAAQNGHLDIVELLLELTDADIAATDARGKTAAHLALENNHFDIYHTLQNHG
ncbi:hypothetical protein HG530_007784 [Fusarium avenaceum]|nr:hypothetical protein HG530_007784 [Fusarium avenaceum]